MKVQCEARIPVVLPTILWDSVVDSLGADYGLDRMSGRWSYQRIGYGGRYTVYVIPSLAERIAHYLEGHAELFAQTWAMSSGQAESMRESKAAAKAAARIRKMLAEQGSG